MTVKKPKGNKYDVPFLNMDRKMKNEVWNQSTPKRKATKKSGQK